MSTEIKNKKIISIILYCNWYFLFVLLRQKNLFKCASLWKMFLSNWNSLSITRCIHLLIGVTTFVVKVHKVWEAADGDSIAVVKCKMHCKGPNTTQTPMFVGKVQKIINKKLRKLTPLLVLKFTRHSIRRIEHEDHWFKLRVMQNGQFMIAMTKENSLICAKCLLSKFNHEEPGMLWFFSNEKNSDQGLSIEQRMTIDLPTWLCTISYIQDDPKMDELKSLWSPHSKHMAS